MKYTAMANNNNKTSNSYHFCRALSVLGIVLNYVLNWAITFPIFTDEETDGGKKGILGKRDSVNVIVSLFIFLKFKRKR